MSYGDEVVPSVQSSPVLDAASAIANAAKIERSLVMLQKRFGQQHGQGDAVELFHALGDLISLAAELKADVGRALQRPSRIGSQVDALKDEQARNLWRCIEAVTTAGATVKLQKGSVEVTTPDGVVLAEQDTRLANAAAQVLGLLVSREVAS